MMYRMAWILKAALIWICLIRGANAFTSPRATSNVIYQLSGVDKTLIPTPSRSSSSSTIVMMAGFRRGVPIVQEWQLLRSGSISGSVYGHPTFEDGDFITTSPLQENSSCMEGLIVSTESGSKYKLGRQKGSKQQKQKQQQQQQQQQQPRKQQRQIAKKAVRDVINGESSSQMKEQEKQPKREDIPLSQRLKDAKKKYNLSGQTIGNGKYLLSGKPFRSTSGKSQIYMGYKSDRDGLPTGDPLVLKISSNLLAIEREYENFQRITSSGLFRGKFVQCIDYLSNAAANSGGTKGFEQQCALVIEYGTKDLKVLLAERGGRGLEGRAMRDAAAVGAQCLQAVHSSGYVWTDMKTENFVILSDSTGDLDDYEEDNVGLSDIRGIDLESAIAIGKNPVDYSPEACPPEFATMFVRGDGIDFVLEPSYDLWSYGMLLYELATGKAYFDGKSPLQITKALTMDTFQANIDTVTDQSLRDLIRQCLQTDPKKRPNIAQVLLHPYFLTTGIGPFSFK